MPILPGATEDEQTFISRCMKEETQTYPQDQSYAICKSKWDTNMGAVKMSNEDMMVKSLNHYEAKLAAISLQKNGINLADYPWDECIADQSARYGEEAAPRICGWIKSNYGGGE